MIIQKYGGTSIGGADQIKYVAKLIQDGQQKIVVLSAVSGTTNKLTEIVQALYKAEKDKVHGMIKALEVEYAATVDALFDDADTKQKATELLETHWNHIRSFTLDMFTRFEERTVLAQGELISTMLMQMYLEEQNVQSQLIPALDFMRIDQQNEPDMWYVKSNLERILKERSGVDLFITQGYICRNHFGDIDNLKRGGSDYTASIIGAAIKASEVQIWTDIDGMHNNDPRVVEKTFPIAKLTFDEAAELAYFGAKILHPSSIVPARTSGISVVLKNTMQPEKPGTVISNKPSGDFIKAVAAKDSITAIKIKSDRMLLAYGFLRKVFEVFERYRIAIDMITTSEVAVSLTIDDDRDLSELVEDLQQYGAVEVERDQCIICIVGHLLQEETGHAAAIFGALKDIPLRMISYGGSKNNVSILINADQKVLALRALNRGLFNLEA
ncbi:MAG: aspartate kinase [Salibacteraceae bacterium]